MLSLHVLKLICFFSIIVRIYGFNRACHNYYADNKANCTDVIYTYENKNVSCSVCHDEGKEYNVTVCRSDEFNITVPCILKAVPHDVEYLIISFDNVWNGYLPLKPDPIELEFIKRLKNIKYFQISDNYYQFYQLYPFLINQSDLGNLTSLKYLRFRLPLMDNDDQTSGISLLDIVKNLTLLEVLDLSYTRGLGLKKIFDIMMASNKETIQRMCFRMIQLPGGLGYKSKFPYFHDGNIVFANVVELDISDNSIANMLPGVSNMFPNLQFLDITGNMLLDIGNMAVIIEAFVHPNLQILYAGFQRSSAYDSAPAISAKHNNTKHSIPKNIQQMLKDKAFHFIVDCANSASGYDNFSSIIMDSIKSCKFFVCLIPSIFQEISCEKQRFIPPLGKMYHLDCLFFVNLPIGLNLCEIQFSNVHLEHASTVGVCGQKALCLPKNNRLERLDFQNNNKWMESAQLQNAIERLTGVRNFESLRRVDISNNAIDITANVLFNGVFPNITYLDISRNVVNLTSYCKVIPNVEILILSYSKTSDVDSSLVKDCTKLKYLNLDFNYKLNVSSLNNLNLSNTRNLRYISMKQCSIDHLEYGFMQKLNTYNNLTIDLSDNPLSCGCDEASQNFTKWLIETNKGKFNIVNFDQIYCSGPGGDKSLSKLNIKTYWSLCQTYSLETLIVSIVSTLSASILAALIVALYRVRWRLRYIIFKIQQFFKQICICSGSSNKHTIWKYDAFISYCAEDRFWVHDTLMKTLEGKYGFRLCIHYRDFPVGGDIAETISNSMTASQEIIIVLSDVAMKSEWCNFELDEALRQINRRTQHLIVIKLGKIKTNLLNSKIAHLLDTHTFLEWSDNNKHHKLFWATLVGKLYNDPHGQCTCCCPYGARSLGYEDIIDPQEDMVDEVSQEFDHQFDLSLLPAEATQRWNIGVQAKRKAFKAEQFKSTFEEILKDEDLPQWAFGPIPWPVDQLLQNNRTEMEDQVYLHARERITLLIKCLSKQVEIESNVYATQIEQIQQLRQRNISEDHSEQ